MRHRDKLNDNVTPAPICTSDPLNIDKMAGCLRAGLETHPGCPVRKSHKALHTLAHTCAQEASHTCALSREASLVGVFMLAGPSSPGVLEEFPAR